MEAGRLPWVKPWDTADASCAVGLPQNAVSSKPYSGINILLLWGAVIERSFPGQLWLTFKQAKALGGTVRKGERGTVIVYADRFIPDQEREQARVEDREAVAVPFLKRYRVFNAAQCDGLPDRVTRQVSPLPAMSVEPEAERLAKATGADITPTKLIWNASHSLPVGLYWVRNRTVQHGDLVLVRLPKNASAFAADRRILPADTPALKRVAALNGDGVCRFGQAVSVNGEWVARAQWSDGLGRRMPVWSGCRVLTGDKVLLLADHPKSFDGRYFGVTKIGQIIGVAMPLWTSGPVDR